MSEHSSVSKPLGFSEVNTFEGFRGLASRRDISKYEKIGFPDDYRSGFELEICDDIIEKLQLKKSQGNEVLDIGSGCSDLPNLLFRVMRENKHHLTLLDSFEMHANLPEETLNGTKQIVAQFPYCVDFINEYSGSFDSIICYSVIQYSYFESSIFAFLDAMLVLLRPGGRLLIGDIPNISTRKRFLDSEAGKEFHKNFFGDSSAVSVNWNSIEKDRMDDAVVLSMIMRARAAGFHAYIVPQNSQLPLSNRREDILIMRP